MAEKFDEFFRENFGKVYRFFCIRAGKIDAEDLSQETFIKIARNGKYSLAYLFKTAGSVLVDFLRKKYNTRLNEKVALFSEAENFIGFVEDDIDSKRFFEECKATLNFQEFTVLELRFFEELSFKEIASVVEKSEGAVKMMFFRAMEKLRDLK